MIMTSFIRCLQNIFADAPYELVRDLELHYQNACLLCSNWLVFM